MADDLSVRFAGDTSALNASIAAARATLAAFAPGATAGAKSSLDDLAAAFVRQNQATQASTAGWRDNLQVAANAALVYGATRSVIGDLAAGFTTLAAATLGAEVAIGKAAVAGTASVFSNEAKAIASVDGALLGYFTSAAYAQRGAEMFTQANDGVVASIGRAILSIEDFVGVQSTLANTFGTTINRARLFVSSVAGTEYAAIAAAGGIQAFETALSASGATDYLTPLTNFTAELEKIPNTSDAAAASIQVMLATIPNYSVEANDVLVKLIQTLATSGDEAVALATKITGAFKDDKSGGQALGDIVAGIKNVDGQLRLAGTLAKSLSPTQAVAMYDRIQTQLKAQQELLKAQGQEAERNLALLAGEDEATRAVADAIRAGLAADKERLDAIGQQNLLLEVQRQRYQGIADVAKEQREFQDALDKGSTPRSRKNDLEEQNKTLQGGLDSRKSAENTDAPGDNAKSLAIATAVLEAGNQTDEGLKAFFNVLKNRLNASYGNYGASLEQVLKKPRAFTAIDDDSGNYDRTKLSQVNMDGYQFKRAQALYDKVFGENPEDDPTKGATHYYNPSRVTPKWASSASNVHDIGDHRFGNPDGPPVTSDDNAEKAHDLIGQNNVEIAAQNALIEGGTAAEKAQLDALAAKATKHQDDVVAAQKALDIAKQQLEVTGQSVGDDGKVEADDDSKAIVTPQVQTKAAETYYNAVTTLREADAARAKSAIDLQTAQTQEGSKERLASQMAGFAAQRAAANGNVNTLNEIQKQQVEAVKAYNKQQADNAKEAENEKFEATKARLANERKLIEENQKAGGTSPRAASADVQATYRQEEAAATQHAAALLAIDKKYGTDSVEVIRKTNADAAKEQLKLTTEQTAAVQKANAEMLASYKSAFGQIGSTVSGDIMGMLEGTKRFGDLAKDVAKNIAKQFIDAGVKMASDWVARQAFMVVQTALGQTQQTAAVLTGETARTGAIGAGAAAQQAVTATSILSSIAASAAESFAGVFGFLSPVLGPAAAGPAAAAQATVAAVGGSFAVGAWSLPSDMIAQVHAGEMIVPSGPAAMMRAAAGGAGVGGQSAPGGGDTHNHFNISAVDARGVEKWARTSGRALFSGLSAAQRNGAGLGLKGA